LKACSDRRRVGALRGSRPRAWIGANITAAPIGAGGWLSPDNQWVAIKEEGSVFSARYHRDDSPVDGRGHAVPVLLQESMARSLARESIP